MSIGTAPTPLESTNQIWLNDTNARTDLEYWLAQRRRTTARPEPGFQKELRLLERIPDREFRPSKYAYRTAWWLLQEAYIYLTDSFPEPSIAPDGEGGISIDWTNDGRLVRLDIPMSSLRRAYVYYEHGQDHGVVYELSAKVLANWLNWLNA